MKLKELVLSVFVIGLLFVISCRSNDPIEIVDATEQFEQNKVDIANFFADIDLPDPDTTSSGVRFAMVDNDSSDIAPQPGDIVSLDYVAYRLDGTLLGTTFQSVVDTTEVFSAPGDNLIVSHTLNGWAFEELFVNVAGAFRTNGFRDGVTAVLNEGMNGNFHVGDRGILGVPATQTVTTLGGVTQRLQGIPADVIIYEFQLLEILK